MTTFRDLVGLNSLKPMIAYSCSWGGSDDTSSSPSNDDKPAAEATPTFNSLAEASDAGYHGKAVEIAGKGVQKVEFADKSYNDNMAKVSANVSNTSSNTNSNTNTGRQNLANDLTPNNDTEYRNGNLTNISDGSLVTENTGYQDLANFATPTDGKKYEDGQMVADPYTAPTVTAPSSHPTDNDDNYRPAYVAPVVDTTPPILPPEVEPDPPVIEEEEEDLTEIIDTFTNNGGGGGGGNVTSLPGPDLTDDQVAEYLEKIDVSSNAYDPAAFMNSYGFALEPGEGGEIISSTVSADGLYMRRAVRDRVTGEIRYVNVPIGKGATHGNNGVSQFRMERRNGFSNMV